MRLIALLLALSPLCLAGQRPYTSLVDLAAVDTTLRFDLRYATACPPNGGTAT